MNALSSYFKLHDLAARKESGRFVLDTCFRVGPIPFYMDLDCGDAATWLLLTAGCPFCTSEDGRPSQDPYIVCNTCLALPGPAEIRSESNSSFHSESASFEAYWQRVARLFPLANPLSQVFLDATVARALTVLGETLRASASKLVDDDAAATVDEIKQWVAVVDQELRDLERHVPLDWPAHGIKGNS